MTTPLTKVQGVGSHTASILEKHGIKSAEDLAQATTHTLMEVPGFGPLRAAKIISTAQSLFAAQKSKPEPTVDTKEKGKPSKKKKVPKSKKGKKDKATSGKKKKNKKQPDTGKKKKKDKKGKKKKKKK